MALFKPYKITSDKLEDLAIKEGQLIVTTDTKKLYVDVSATERIEVAADAEVDLTDYVTTSILTSTIGQEASARQKQDQLLEQAIDDKVGADDIIAGNNIQVNHDDVSGHITISATDTNTNTTYTLSKSGSTITLSGSDGRSTSVTDANTTYSLGSFGITASAAELNKLDGVTATTTELNYMDGVTSNIQTQLNGKAATSHTHSYLPLSGGTLTGTLTSRAITPSADSTYDIGTSAVRYRNIYADTITASTFNGSVSNAITATQANYWTTARTLTFTGDVTGSVSIRGNANMSCAMSLAANSVTANEIAANAVGTSEIAANAVTLAKLGSDVGTVAVQTAEPTDSNVKLWIKI